MFFNWLRWLEKTRRQTRKANRPYRRPNFRPEFEMLETRLAPAVIATVNTLNDAHAANAASSPVDTNGGGEISLRSAIEYANASNLAGTINFTAGLNGTIGISALNTLNVTDNNAAGLTIDGTGATIAISGQNLVQVFLVNGGVTATINDLSIANGNTSGGGGGIQIQGSATVTLSNDTVANNSSTRGPGGGIYNASSGNVTITNDTITNNSVTNGNGGGIENLGTMTISNSTITKNSAFASSAAGGVLNDGTMTISNSTIASNTANDDSGGVFNGGTLTLSNDTVANNAANFGGGGIINDGAGTISNSTIANNSSITKGGGGILNGGTLALSNDTVANNTAAMSGGGIVSFAGCTLTITNSTIANNSANGGGGISNGGTLTLSNDTVANNTAATDGGGISSGGSGGNLTIADTILAGNTGTNGPDCYTTAASKLTDKGYNLIGNTAGSSGFSTANHDILNPARLGLGALHNNGGPTQTIAELAGCPALGAGTATTLATPSGVTANQTTVSSGALATGNYAYTVTAFNAFGETLPSSEVTVTVTAPKNAAAVSWNPILGDISGYKIYGRTSGSELLIGTVSAATTSFTDNGTITPAGAMPTSNTTTLTTDQRGFPRGASIDIGAFQNQSQLFVVTPPVSNPNPEAGNAAAFSLGSFTESGSPPNIWNVDVNWGDGSPDTTFAASSPPSAGPPRSGSIKLNPLREVNW